MSTHPKPADASARPLSTIVEPLTPEWRAKFLESRNSVFTPLRADYLDRIEIGETAVPVHTYICRTESRVLAWGSFYLRDIESGGNTSRPLRLAQACAIGTLPEFQRKGLGRKVWRLAEESLAREADGIMIYTSEGGDGYSFYRAMGYLPLAYPSWLSLGHATQFDPPDRAVKTTPLAEARHQLEAFGGLFTDCYQGCAGFFAHRPQSLADWARASFFYDAEETGAEPQISWLEDADGQCEAYAIWAGPLRKVGWKRNAVEVWELASREDCPTIALAAVLSPAITAIAPDSSLDWWAIPNHYLTAKLVSLGFEERPRSLCVLGKLFDPTSLFRQNLPPTLQSLHAETQSSLADRVEIRWEDTCVEIEREAATRLLFGRSTLQIESIHGLVTVRPSQKIEQAIAQLGTGFRNSNWAYLASEFI